MVNSDYKTTMLAIIVVATYLQGGWWVVKLGSLLLFPAHRASIQRTVLFTRVASTRSTARKQKKPKKGKSEL